MCGCNSGRSSISNAARMSPEELVAAAEARAAERRALLVEQVEREQQSMQNAMANAGQ